MSDLPPLTLRDVLRNPDRFYNPHAHAERAFEPLALSAWYSSSQNFEQQSGMTDIAARYRFPEGLTRESIGDVLLQERVYYSVANDLKRGGLPPFSKVPQVHQEGQGRLQILLNVIDRMAEANPNIRGIPFDRGSRIEVVEVLAGIHYDFNPQDIAYYVRRESNSDYGSQGLQSMLSRLGRASGAQITWRPSPATIQTIYNSMSIEQKEKFRALPPDSVTARVEHPVPNASLATKLKSPHVQGGLLGVAGAGMAAAMEADKGVGAMLNAASEAVLPGSSTAGHDVCKITGTVTGGVVGTVAAAGAGTATFLATAVPLTPAGGAAASLVAGGVTYSATQPLVKEGTEAACHALLPDAVKAQATRGLRAADVAFTAAIEWASDAAHGLVGAAKPTGTRVAERK